MHTCNSMVTVQHGKMCTYIELKAHVQNVHYVVPPQCLNSTILNAVFYGIYNTSQCFILQAPVISGNLMSYKDNRSNTPIYIIYLYN